MNENEEILLWYIDMIADQGADPDGVPYFDDLYLDLIVYPDGTIKEDDMDELAETLAQKEISEEQYPLLFAFDLFFGIGHIAGIKTAADH